MTSCKGSLPEKALGEEEEVAERKERETMEATTRFKTTANIMPRARTCVGRSSLTTLSVNGWWLGVGGWGSRVMREPGDRPIR